MSKRNILLLLCLTALALAIALLYAPFLSNGLVFDDHNVLSNLSLYDDAILPFSFRPRTFPYFTLGFVQVMFGSIEAQSDAIRWIHFDDYRWPKGAQQVASAPEHGDFRALHVHLH